MDKHAVMQTLFAEVADYYRERGIFQAKFGFGRKPALIVIDMAYGWTDPAYAGGSARLEPALHAIAQLLPIARAKKVPIFYTTSAPGLIQFKSAADPSPKFRAWDARACEIDSRVAALPTELVLPKEHASAFAGTPLVGHLIQNQIDSVLITGCSTSACVRATATDAKSVNLKPILIREAVQDRCEVLHEFTLFDLQARFADVVSLADALSYLQQLA